MKDRNLFRIPMGFFSHTPQEIPKNQHRPPWILSASLGRSKPKNVRIAPGVRHSWQADKAGLLVVVLGPSCPSKWGGTMKILMEFVSDPWKSSKLQKKYVINFRQYCFLRSWTSRENYSKFGKIKWHTLTWDGKTKGTKCIQKHTTKNMKITGDLQRGHFSLAGNQVRMS